MNSLKIIKSNPWVMDVSVSLQKEVDNIDKTVDNIQSENLELGQTVSELEQSVDE